MVKLNLRQFSLANPDASFQKLPEIVLSWKTAAQRETIRNVKQTQEDTSDFDSKISSDHLTRSCRYRERTEQKRSTHQSSGPGRVVSDQPPHHCHTLIETGDKVLIRRHRDCLSNLCSQMADDINHAADNNTNPLKRLPVL
ncbi:hypothetical protein RRG08_051312 [Elysia crispata]|uniref:Uncharacterized protein n=1 Tax=Elysia crispata TaxID=231223 RepID=A0AAE0ZI34_9GAST|nr:hypothetical protein RRG08_051312 [Elysia crispata]